MVVELLMVMVVVMVWPRLQNPGAAVPVIAILPVPPPAVMMMMVVMMMDDVLRLH